jgi:plastocyanin
MEEVRMIRMFIATAVLFGSLPVQAQVSEYTLDISNHRFQPAELKIPAGKKVRLVVRNLDATVEEFESHELNREKLIPANGKALIYVGPLAAGRYPFFGEFNPKTAVGTLIAE